jgi:hypothetical protein
MSKLAGHIEPHLTSHPSDRTNKICYFHDILANKVTSLICLVLEFQNIGKMKKFLINFCFIFCIEGQVGLDDDSTTGNFNLEKNIFEYIYFE